ncbi:hypothetical protein [Streptomyces sp. NPDC050804]|uniref:hypothetical protein n=1 Tax=Streptomyces sp. NPDC050804 TaxID=3154745 RepID=UPI003422E329
MKLALVSGDGLPVSGLLTIFRNVMETELANEGLELPVVADLGFSWRPDKQHFFPRGSEENTYPDWMSVSTAVPLGAGRADLMRELTWIRGAVARSDTLDDEESALLRRAVESLAGPYEEYFTRWFEEHDVDWVCAVNMTLSDAVPVTLGLHRAAARRWSEGVPGGVLFWDHDLFASYSVFEEGARVYPPGPNRFTPLPGTHPCHRWAVVSPALAEEVKEYPTPLGATTVPNVLPALGPEAPPSERHSAFLEQRGIDPDRPLILVPVRVFQVKGVEISVSMFAEIKRLCEERRTPVPCLLVFGSLDEDPPYAQKVVSLVQELNVQDDVVFLDGVPLSSHQDATGQWRPDEIDLLRMCRAGGGAVLFTPNTSDVESVGLGPALAAIAEVPCAITDYACFEDIYGTRSSCVRVSGGKDIPAAAVELFDLMEKNRRGDPGVREDLRRDKEHVLRSFDPEPWRRLFREMVNEADGTENDTKHVGPS